MNDLRWKLILIGAVFVLSWSVVVLIVYPYLDAQEWLPPPFALVVPIAMYSLVGFLFSFGLVGFDPNLTFHSVYLGILEALGLLALDGLEPPITVAPNGILNTTVTGFRSDILTTWFWIGKMIGIPENFMMFYFVVFGLVITWVFVVVLATREIVKEYLEALA